MSELSGQIALVTGGSRGIGLAVSTELARAGCTVAVIGRDEEAAREAAAGLEGGGHRAYSCDVSDTKSAATVVGQITEDLGVVEILVHNAGITRDNLLIRMKEDEWDDVLAVNLKGAFNMTKALARGMMKRRSGVILNAGQANYAASQAGLIGFTKSIAKELASRGVRCNAIAPGFINTDMTAELPEATVAKLQDMIPLGHLGEPADIAGLARFLAGPAARYITGQVISVDGGMAM